MSDELMSMASGMAALSVCEALALALVEAGVLTRDDASQAFQDAISMHRNVGATEADADLHRMAAYLVEMIKKSVEIPSYTH